MFNKLLAGFPLLIFFLVLGAVTWLLGEILKPFFFAIFWAVLLAAKPKPSKGCMLQNDKTTVAMPKSKQKPRLNVLRFQCAAKETADTASNTPT